MNTLIIYTHPNHNSLNYEFLQVVQNRLMHGQENFRLVDLYKDQFNPVLTYNENIRRRDMHKDVEMANYQENVKWAERIVFIYPIFWARPPAMLLGFIDRLFASGFAYKDTGKLLPEGLLKDKEVIVISTMKGPKHYIRLFLNNAHQVLMRRALFNYVGIKRVKFFEFGGLEGSSPSATRNRTRALEKIDQYFKRVDKLKVQI